VKSLTCMGMAMCSLRSIMHKSQRGRWVRLEARAQP
jgi:hypothetical protein